MALIETCTELLQLIDGLIMDQLPSYELTFEVRITGQEQKP